MPETLKMRTVFVVHLLLFISGIAWLIAGANKRWLQSSVFAQTIYV